VILLVSLVFFWGRLEDDVVLVECVRCVMVVVAVMELGWECRWEHFELHVGCSESFCAMIGGSRW